MISEKMISRVLCSIQGCLRGNVTPNLRAVYVRIIQEYEFELTFYYDLKPSEEEEELASLADTEFISDFPPPECTTHCSVKVLPYPERIKQDGYCVYERYEKPLTTS